MNPVALFQRLRLNPGNVDIEQNQSESTMRLAQTVSQLQQQTAVQTNTLTELQQKIQLLERENQKLTIMTKNASALQSTSPLLSATLQKSKQISLDSIITKYASDPTRKSQALHDSQLDKKIEVGAGAEGTGAERTGLESTGRSIVHDDPRGEKPKKQVNFEVPRETEQTSIQAMYPGAFQGSDGQWYYYPQQPQAPDYAYQQQQGFGFQQPPPQQQNYAYQQPNDLQLFNQQQNMAPSQSFAFQPQQFDQQQIDANLMLTQDPDYENYMRQYEQMQQQMQQFTFQNQQPEQSSIITTSSTAPSAAKPRAQQYPKKTGIVSKKDENGIPLFKVSVDTKKGSRRPGQLNSGKIRLE